MADAPRAAILLVEDDLLISLDETETLRAAGYAVVEASSGAEALDLLSTTSFDLILMDIDLGSEPDGIETAIAIQRGAPRPLLFLSARDDDETFRRLSGVPAFGLVRKSSGSGALVAAVGMAVRMASLEAERRERDAVEAARRLAEAQARTKEAHHRVRNNIATIRAIMSMQLDAGAQASDALKDAIARLDSVSSLHELLATMEDGASVSVKPYLERLLATVGDIFSPATTLSLSERIDDFELDAKRAMALGIILNELFTNIQKYAFTGLERGSIAIDVCAYDESVIMTIRDDGKGLPDGFEETRSAGLGLSLVSILLEQFQGTLAMRSDQGTTTTVLIQAPGLRPASASRDLAAAEALAASAKRAFVA